MNRLKLFIENFFIYGIGGMISKIIPLIMLPVITRLMPDTFYFGLSDLSNTVVSFGSAIALMGMYDAMFRLFFDKDDIQYKKEICSSALAFTLLTSIVVFLILIVFRSSISQLIFSDKHYQNLLILTSASILVGSTNSIVAAPTRMQNNKITYLTANIMGSVISYTVTIILLKNHLYLIALPLGSLISVLSLETFFYIVNRRWFQLNKINWKYIKQMLLIGLPLVPNFLIYWIFNSSDRLMIAKLLGNEYTGIYAVGAKIAQISQMIYMAFSGGWQYFAFSTMKDKDQVQLTSNVFEYLGIISFAAGMLMAAISSLIFNLFFNGNYVQGMIVAPWLFLAPLLQMLYQVIGNQFLVIKKTWPSIFILGLGAVFNIIANLFLIPWIGIEGAALATLLGYCITVVVCNIVLANLKLVKIQNKFYISTFLTVLYFCVWRLITYESVLFSLGLACSVIMIQIYLYRDVFKTICNKIKNRTMR